MYVTPAQLADSPGATELAQVATPENSPVVDTGLMDAVLRGMDTSAWPPSDVAVANIVLAKIVALSSDADGMIEGFLERRGYPLPLNPVPPIVVGWARAVVRYKLHKDRITDARTDPIARDYSDAQKLLQLTASGNFSLGIGDNTSLTGAGMPQTAWQPICRPGPWDIPE